MEGARGFAASILFWGFIVENRMETPIFYRVV